MRNLKTIEKKVRAVLEKNEDARNDDMVLYLVLCNAYKLTGNKRKILLLVIDVLILLLAVFVFVIGGFKLAMSARAEYSALLGIPRTLVYAVSPVSGIFIVVAQIINIYEDLTGVKVE